MRNLILGAASALTLATPAAASDLPVTSYSESYARSYEYRSPPPVVVEELAPVVSETVVVRRPVVVAPPRVVVEEYPVMRHRACMRYLCLPPGRVGGADGAIDVTSTAVGKVLEFRGTNRGSPCEVMFGRSREPCELPALG